jgi:hypothetical protein
VKKVVVMKNICSALGRQEKFCFLKAIAICEKVFF